MTEARKGDPRERGSRAVRLGPGNFSVGVVDSLGRGFVGSKDDDVRTWRNPVLQLSLRRIGTTQNLGDLGTVDI